MPSISFSCPYCRTEKSCFTGNAFQQKAPQTNVYNVLMQCGVCGESIVAQIHDPQLLQWVNGVKTIGNLLHVYPKPESPNYPQHLPSNVVRFYQQADDAFMRRNWDSAGTMFRKALDTGLRSLDPSSKGNLQARIDNLPESVGVTSAMKTWAHRIRRLGNDAAHEDDPFTEEDAKDLRSFTELFLTYAFTLPGMMANAATP